MEVPITETKLTLPDIVPTASGQTFRGWITILR